LRNALVVCSDQKMLPAACCVLLSAHQLASQPLSFFLVIEGEADERPIKDFAHWNGIEIKTVRHDGAGSGLTSTRPKFTATLTRLYLNSLLPSDLDRVLYLDCDVLVYDDVCDLLSVDMQGCALAAVDDVANKNRKHLTERERRKDLLSMRREAMYFNAGVLVFDWQKALRLELLQRAAAAYWKDPSQYPLHDQDVLNAIIDGDVLSLPAKWNQRPRYRVLDSGIVHFVGSGKPWQEGSRARYWPYRTHYRKLLTKSDWHDFLKPLNIQSRIELLKKSPALIREGLLKWWHTRSR
jgi:lipopolysaccharide biosynthesis glycosyltransferase